MLDDLSVSRVLPHAPRLYSAGRTHSVDIRYGLPLPRQQHERPEAQRPPPIRHADLATLALELVGCAETPTVAGGRVPVLVHLLSPAGRPLQVTADLGSFWRDGYSAVRREQRGRYPKHPWPADPLAAEATTVTRRRR